ncbi:ABC transporter permease [Luteimicrobium subarcticum]|uniref:ABC-2 family transporter n=1 Tax=Luteimicrobium subarcticum TaxID=620910 RepID=A0A2M8W6I0_9MICO|nr:ABC transporter permease subunit [Luteimicrobium subarcticum]PJI86540.1 ABC-2 family transporter [Luteimicrobium subarcticum]
MNAAVTVQTDGGADGATAPSAHAPRPRTPGTWTLRRRGLATVCALELRQRVRSTRWRIALLAWFLVVGLVTVLAFTASAAVLGDDRETGLHAVADGGTLSPGFERGPLIFGLVVFFVLLAGLLVAPTLSAGAVNGDRTSGTLAILQVTLLSPAEIVVGKLLAGWVAALAFLVAALPFVLVSVAAGGVGIGSLVTTLALLVVLLGVVCALGIGFSALVSRTTASALLTYLTVLGLVVGTVIVFGLTFPLVTQDDQVRVRDWSSVSSDAYPQTDADGTTVWIDPETGDEVDEPSTSQKCAWSTETESRAHTERTWWLLAPNPFVIVADAAPTSPSNVWFGTVDPLRAIRDGVREARSGPDDGHEECGPGAIVRADRSTPSSGAAVWPWGLAFDVLLGAGAVALAVRRLRVPQQNLPRGTRVA